MVDASSGTIIHTEPDENKFYMLTSYHVIHEYHTNNEALTVFSTHSYKTDEGELETFVLVYSATVLNVDEYNDLALLEVDSSPVRPIYGHVTIATEEPDLGEDIFVISNPNGNFRSVTKGVVSNKERVIDSNIMWQLSGGILFGASGGAAFNQDGELIAVAKSVDAYITPNCAEYYSAQGVDVGVCATAAPYIGYFVPLYEIHEFLLNSEIGENFKYLE